MVWSGFGKDFLLIHWKETQYKTTEPKTFNRSDIHSEILLEHIPVESLISLHEDLSRLTLTA